MKCCGLKLAFACVSSLALACGGRTESDTSLPRTTSGGMGAQVLPEPGRGGSGPNAAAEPARDWNRMTWTSEPTYLGDNPPLPAGEAPLLAQLWSGSPGEAWGIQIFGTRGGPVSNLWHFEREQWQVFAEDFHRFALATDRASAPLAAGLDYYHGTDVASFRGDSWVPWQTRTKMARDDYPVPLLASSSGTDVWFISHDYGHQDDAAHWDGAEWRHYEIAPVAQVFARSPMDAWAVGSAGLVQHWDGSSWRGQTVGAFDWTCVGSPAEDDVWVASATGEIAHSSGDTRFSTFDAYGKSYPRAPGRLNAIWASGADNVWIVGEAGAVLHWNGASWNEQVFRDAGTLSAITGNAAEVWISGSDALLRGRASEL